MDHVLKNLSKNKLPIALLVFVLCQPFIDIITSFQVENGQSLTAGTIIRSLFMVLCFGYTTLGVKKHKNKISFFGSIIIAAYCVIFLALCYFRGGFPCVFGNVREMVKVFYFPFLLLAAFALYQSHKILVGKKVLIYTGILYMSSIFIAYITGTGLDSYGYGAGNKGWFYAANEIGIIIGMLTPAIICYCTEILFKNLKGNIKLRLANVLISIIGLGLTIFCSISIGTKVVFFSILGYFLCFTIWQFISCIREKKASYLAKALVALLLSGVIVGLYFISPLQQNVTDSIEIHYSDDVVEKPEKPNSIIEKEEASSTYQFANWILSDRLTIVEPVIQTFDQGDITAKLFGIGYEKYGSFENTMEKSVEMDFISLFLRHGIIGFLLYAWPVVYYLFIVLKRFFQNFKCAFFSIEYCTYLYSIILGLGISFLAGHVISAPAVSIYLVLYLVLAYDESSQCLKPAQ